MIHLPCNSLDDTYSAFKSYYVAKNGMNKFEQVYNEIATSDKLKELFRYSAQNRSGLSGSDFFGLVFYLRYFIFAKNETRALGALIALKLWNDNVNKVYNIADTKSLNYKVEVILTKFCII